MQIIISVLSTQTNGLIRYFGTAVPYIKTPKYSENVPYSSVKKSREKSLYDDMPNTILYFYFKTSSLQA